MIDLLARTKGDVSLPDSGGLQWAIELDEICSIN